MRNVLIVESPNKVKKLRGYLETIAPGEWSVMATVGHWRGLPPMDGQTFESVAEPGVWNERFTVHRTDVLKQLTAHKKANARFYLAADNDREGEAIAWHVVDALGLDDTKRVLFNEITQSALAKALETPGALDKHLVDAQRARQVLDYAIGLLVSRKLWRFGAKSAGRVQSAALRIIVDREMEIRAFDAKDFWTVNAAYGEGFRAAVATFEEPTDDELDESGETDKTPKLKAKRFFSLDEAGTYIRSGNGVPHVVETLKATPQTRRPRPPYTTAALQADAATRFSWDPSKTAKIAQSLFEAGLITYIRTDSVALSDDAIADIRGYLQKAHPELLPEKPQSYAERGSAQAAHEAIRPTQMDNPDADALKGDERTLYSAIWARTLACQAKSARIEKTVVTIRPGELDWRLLASGAVVKEAGWLTLEGDGKRAERPLPVLKEGQTLKLTDLSLTNSKTKPKPRFTEAALVRYLERKGIGRPSTYASIFSTLLGRKYVVKIKKQLAPGELGFHCDKLLRTAFNALTEEGFTAKTESALDRIATGELSRTAFLDKFWAGLSKLMAQSDAAFSEYAKAHPELDTSGATEHDKPCKVCGGKMLRKTGKFGPYAQCQAEDCDGREDLSELKKCKEPCPLCSADLVVQPYVKAGKRTTFIRCTACAFRQKKPITVDERHCPHCRGKVLVIDYVDKTTKAKRRFWQCADEKACDWSSPLSPPQTSKWACHNDKNHGPTTRFEGTSKKDGRVFVKFVCHKCEDEKEGKGTFWSGPKPPTCPECSKPTAYRTSAKGDFWGCSTFPKCKGTLPISAS